MVQAGNNDLIGHWHTQFRLPHKLLKSLQQVYQTYLLVSPRLHLVDAEPVQVFSGYFNHVTLLSYVLFVF